MKAALIVLAAGFIAVVVMLILMTIAEQPKSIAEHLQEVYNRNKKDAKKLTKSLDFDIIRLSKERTVL